MIRLSGVLIISFPVLFFLSAVNARPPPASPADLYTGSPVTFGNVLISEEDTRFGGDEFEQSRFHADNIGFIHDFAMTNIFADLDQLPESVQHLWGFLTGGGAVPANKIKHSYRKGYGPKYINHLIKKRIVN